jgi:hypothetical protein
MSRSARTTAPAAGTTGRAGLRRAASAVIAIAITSIIGRGAAVT